MIIRTVTRKKLDGFQMSRYLRSFIRCRMGIGLHTKFVVADIEGAVIGVFAYDWFEQTIFATGTYVEARWRRQGIASKLWKRAHTTRKSKATEVTTVTRSGRRFVEAIKLRRVVRNVLDWSY